ncbi:hypothetical protein EVAR_20517_1 [Eumeta japonica]|uniref:Uncharacterized protein n=1 Tax=Eumeta variegata TaxID=151549 RepID=A0A4C1VKW9_EUMVA|nr:hypothetical protein EVAR_20517_1 [Eumeta japonica]
MYYIASRVPSGTFCRPLSAKRKRLCGKQYKGQNRRERRTTANDSYISHRKYRTIRDLIFPKVVEDVNIRQFLSSLGNHLRANKSFFTEIYKFYTSAKRSGENLAEWTARVRRLAQYCGFKNKPDVALQDCFVLGLENVKEKEKLFAESVEELTLSRALDLAQSVRVVRLAVKNAMFAPATKTAGSGGGVANGTGDAADVSHCASAARL